MAAAKREHEGDGEECLSKKAKSSDDDQPLKAFLAWCKEGSLIISPKVTVTREGSCAQYGMLSAEDIDAGECLFEIPRNLLLTPENCSIAKLLEEEQASIQSDSGWVPLLLALLYEYSNPESKWRSYYQLVPDFEDLDLPMFWPKAEVDLRLKGTGVPEAVHRDVDNLTQDFQNLVLPFVKKHQDKFPMVCQDLNFYKKMVAFVMAYSFTEPLQADDDLSETVKSPPMMVPMADILNHVAKNNARLDFGKEGLKMISTKPIKKGEEVFNTYGELANWQLLHMYGFAEPYPNNHYDTVDIPMSCAYEVMVREKSEDEVKLTTEKWNFLEDMDLVSEDGVFVLGFDGILTEEEMYETLKVLTMDRAKFEEHKEKDGWSESEDEDEDGDSLTNDSIRKLSAPWKDVLRRIMEECLKQYGVTIEEEANQLKKVSEETCTPRQRYSTYVKYSQMKLLHNVIEMCKEQ